MSEILQEPVFTPPPPRGPRRKPWYRRAVLIIPVAVALVAGAIVTAVLVFAGGGPITMRGTVLDSITGKPVASAQINAEAHTATSDAQGAFTLDGIAENAAVTVAAPNYTQTEIKAMSAAATVRLAPIPVRAKLTSGMTGEPLAATLAMPDGVEVTAEPDGTATVYRVGTGNQVTVSAEGYVTTKVAVGPDRTITATLQPTFAGVSAQLVKWSEARQDDAIINWVLSPATGFQYVPSTSVKVDGNPVWMAARDVVGTNTSVVVSVVPGLVLQAETLQSMFGGKATQISVAGQPAWHGPASHGLVQSAWVRQPLAVDVIGSDLSITDTVLAGIVAAQPAS